MGRLLEVKDLTKSYYEGTKENKVVNHVSMKVDAGEFVMVMGSSGSGKTSLLHLLAGIDDPDGGTITYRNVEFGHMGEKAKTKFRRTNIGIVFQQQCLIPDLTVYENIMLPAMLCQDRKERNALTDTILTLCDQIGLKGHVRKYPAQLSGGQQQRAAILRSIINRPSLLLCDEPTGSLNSAQSGIVMELLNRLNRKGQTIILVTHDVKVAVRGKRVIYIKDGCTEGELEFGETGQKEAYKQREDKLMGFLQERGW